jgi:hypothetical protein
MALEDQITELAHWKRRKHEDELKKLAKDWNTKLA